MLPVAANGTLRGCTTATPLPPPPPRIQHKCERTHIRTHARTLQRVRCSDRLSTFFCISLSPPRLLRYAPLHTHTHAHTHPHISTDTCTPADGKRCELRKMGKSTMRTAVRCVGGCLSKALYVFFLILFGLFASGAYHWALKSYRTQPQTINPVMYPSFTEINVTAFAPTMREPYYRLWRTYDWMADGYAAPRIDGVYTRVPLFYVHGNGGSYYCARSLARFVYESNARLRQRAMQQYRRHVKRQLFHEYRANTSLEELEEGARIPEWLQRRVEEKVVLEEVPLLGVELFSVDYLEESSTHAAPIALKEARFLNHTVHLVVQGLLRTYADVLAAPPDLPFDRDTLEESDAHRRGATAGLSSAARKTLKQVEKEYTLSVCSHASLAAEERQCQQAKHLVKRFSTLERVRAEVRRVETHGIWIWAESLGGVTALLAALLAPHLYAGVVMVGTPTHYPPFFFDRASVWLYEVLDAVSLLRYPAPSEVQRARESQRDWPALLADTRRPNELLHDLRAVPRAELHHRLRHLTLLGVNGGTLDDVIPSISGYVQRSTPRLPGTPVNRTALVHEGGHRRDISTETLRGCGAAMDHRGLVYGLQFLQHSADSLVQAALLPDANTYLGREDTLPSLHRDRLFPTVVETLDAHRFDEQRQEHLFMSSVRDSLTGKYVKETKYRALSEQLKQLCVDGDTPIDYNDLPVYDEADALSGYYDGAKTLAVLMGVTTLAPEQVSVPNIQLFYDEARETPTLGSELQERAATLLHLPTTFKGTKAIPGRTLQTAVSFALYRKLKKRRQPLWLWPRFCMLVASDQGLGTTRAFIQYDKISLSAAAETADRGLRSWLPRGLGGGVHVQTQPGFALVRGVDSALLEPDMQVRTDAAAEVFPVVLCGSLHSFYLALRGHSALPADEPEHQLQYFYGPFVEQQHNFTYRWKPFSTYPPQLNETYLIYVLGDNRGTRPEVRLHTYEMLERASIASPEYWTWLLQQWPQRWLAAFSMYTGIVRLAGAAIVLFFTLFFVMGMLDERVGATDALRASLRRRSPFRRLRVLPPLAGMAVAALVLEAATGLWGSTALRVCLSTDPPPYVTEAEMTTRMDVWEKATLVLLYGLAPTYRACRFSWVTMQGVPVWSVFVEEVATVYLGFGMASVFFALIFIYLGVVGAVTWPVRRLLLTPLLHRVPGLLAALLALLWATPTVVFLMCPSVPLCFVDVLSASLLAMPAWMLPRWTRPGYDYRFVFLFVCLAALFPSHFNGLVLTIRNAVMLRASPAAFADAERYSPSQPQCIIFGVVQAWLATAYAALFYFLRNEETLRLADARKASPPDAAASAAEGAGGYLLGDLGRRRPRLRGLMQTLNTLLILASVWMSVMAMRRPLEGSAALLGNMTLLGYLSTLLLKEL
ncbi:PGAP1-like protein/Alpha/beta hydrolase family [Novymonas esmeraldas]|uniref:PGAP1-like protein/Alpha/beta hydrolase family n=1 Tax=Novymonas esmeraldas TaxID=1808958 RepID=A0AAW0F6U3_9TRYP